MPSIKSQPLYATFTDQFIRVDRETEPATAR
jgi:hypothetical protein